MFNAPFLKYCLEFDMEFNNPSGKIYSIRGDHSPKDRVRNYAIAIVAMVVVWIFNPQLGGGPVLVLAVLGWFLRKEYSRLNINTDYVVDSIHNTLTLPLSDEPFCSLSDIGVISFTQESKLMNEKTDNAKIVNHYVVNIVGGGISSGILFFDKSKCDRFHSALTLGVEDVKKYLASQHT